MIGGNHRAEGCEDDIMKRSLGESPARPPAPDSVNCAHQDTLTENQTLRRQLRQMVSEAQRNESALKRFQSLEIDLLGCESLPALLTLLMRDARTRCDWDRVSLFLHDPEHEIRRLLDQVSWETAGFPDLVLADGPQRLDALHGRSRAPRLGPFQPGRHGDLFQMTGAPVASVALLPIVRHGRLFGSYNLGSSSRDRFSRNAGSDFLHHLSAVIAVCLEMTVVRDRLQHLGLADALTGVNNRRFFNQRLPEEIARAQRAGTPLSCLFIDVDHFKRFNDSHGHQAGDQALRAVAQLVRSLLRRSDVLARYGGEEFAAILPEACEEEAAEIAERVRGGVEAARLVVGDGPAVSVTVSIGMATLHPDVPVSEPTGLGNRLVEAADRGVYRAKSEGRNRVIADVPR